MCNMLHLLAAEEGGTCRLDADSLALQVARGEPELIMRVAEQSGACVGCAIAYVGYDVLSASRGLHLSDVFVMPEHRGHGIGTALLASLTEYALMHELEWMSWTMLKTNHAAQRFYERFGASQVDVNFMAMGHSTLQKSLKIRKQIG
jgi:ribosomal protein S18 acetylase RimI-like enzyme